VTTLRRYGDGAYDVLGPDGFPVGDVYRAGRVWTAVALVGGRDRARDPLGHYPTRRAAVAAVAALIPAAP